MYQPREVPVKLKNTILKRGFYSWGWIKIVSPYSRFSLCIKFLWPLAPKNTWKMTAANTGSGSVLGVLSLHFHIRDTLDVSLRAHEAKDIPSISDDPDDMKTTWRIVNDLFNCTTWSITRGSSVQKTGNLLAINTDQLISPCRNFMGVQ